MIILLLVLFLIYNFYGAFCKRPAIIVGGTDSLTDYINNFLKTNSGSAFLRAYKTMQILLYFRYRLNYTTSRLANFRKYIWQNLLNQPVGYTNPYIEPNLIPKDFLGTFNNKTPSRKFEVIFYELAGSNISKNNLDYFPTPDNFICLLPSLETHYELFEGRDPDLAKELDNKLKDKEIKTEVALQMKIHGIEGDTEDLTSEKISLYRKNTVKKMLEDIQEAKKVIIDSKIAPKIVTDTEVATYYISNYSELTENEKHYITNVSITWLVNYKEAIRFYPDYFKQQNKPNSNLTNVDSNILLATITMNHFPVFTNTFMSQGAVPYSYKFELRKSPGLMTSSIPSAQKTIAKLPWLQAEKNYSVPFYDSSPPTMMVETYASPLNHNAKVFCSLFPGDRYVNGCIGKYDETFGDRIAHYKWIPKLLFVNPPYTAYAMLQSFKITDELHKKYPMISITTTSRRDGGLLTPLILPYSDHPFYPEQKGEAKEFMEAIFKSPYMTNFIVVPEDLFEYVDLFTGKSMFTASRKGKLPTDSFVIVKTSIKDPEKLKEVNDILFKSIPKHLTDIYRISDAQKASVESNIMDRAKQLDIDITKDNIDMMIKDFNRAV